MIVKFQSVATANVIMFGDVARRLLEALGKEPTARGVFTPEEYPAALARLNALVEAEKANASSVTMSQQLYKSLGDDLNKAFQDGTHHNAYGSYELAKCVALSPDGTRFAFASSRGTRGSDADEIWLAAALVLLSNATADVTPAWLLPRFILLGVDAPVALRFERSRKRGRIGDGESIEEFRRKEELEKSSQGPGQQLDVCFSMADWVVQNDGTLEDLRRRVARSEGARLDPQPGAAIRTGDFPNPECLLDAPQRQRHLPVVEVGGVAVVAVL